MFTVKEVRILMLISMIMSYNLGLLTLNTIIPPIYIISTMVGLALYGLYMIIFDKK